MPLSVPVASDHPGSLSAQITRWPDGRSCWSRSPTSTGGGRSSEADGHTFAEAARARPGRRPAAAGHHRVERSRRERRRGRPPRLGHGGPHAGPLLGPRAGAASPPPDPSCPGPPCCSGLADHVVMTEDAYAFVSGPAHGRDLHRRGARRDGARRGRHPRHQHRASRRWSSPTPSAARRRSSTSSPTCPRSSTRSRPRWWTDDPVDRPTPEAGACIPASPTGGYDVRDVAAQHRRRRRPARAARRTGRRTSSPRFATIGGRPVGIVANQPMSIAGTLDIPASQKGARFVAVLRRLRPPAAHPRRHARLLPRQGPRVARDDPPRRAARLRLRPGHGARGWRSCSARPTAAPTSSWTAAAMGSDLYLAWPSAEIAVMGAKGAVEILHRRETPERRGRARGGVRGALPEPVRGRRSWLRRRRDRPGRHPARGGGRLRAAGHQARAPRQPQARQHSAVIAPGRGWVRSRAWPTASRSPTTAPASRSRCRSSTEASTARSGASCCPGIWFYDPALMTTAVDVELDHRPRRRERDPPLPRATRSSSWPSSRPTSRSRTSSSTASCPPRSSSTRGSTTSRTTRSSTRTCASASSRASTTTPIRWGCSCPPSPRCRPSTPTPGEIHDPANRYKQIVRLIAKMPTLAAACHRFSVGHAVRLPGQLPQLHRELPVDAVEGRRAALRRQPGPRPAPSTCCSSSTPTTSRTAAPRRCAPSARPTPTRYVSTASAAAALYGPRHGGANEAVIHMLTEIGSIDNVPAFIESVKDGKRPPARASGTASTRATTRGPRSSSRPPTRCSPSPARTRCSTSPSSSRRSPSPTTTSSRGSSTRTSTSTRG